jgi:hypothetical protein
MSLLDIMDAIQVHAASAAVTAGGSKFTDVQVGFPANRGRCVRIFYAGEREPEHFFPKTLNSALMAQAIMVRAYWPLSESAPKRHRAMEGEMGSFVDSFRTRILGDSQLGVYGKDLNMSPASATQTQIDGTNYAIIDLEIVVDYSEYSIQP